MRCVRYALLLSQFRVRHPYPLRPVIIQFPDLNPLSTSLFLITKLKNGILGKPSLHPPLYCFSLAAHSSASALLQLSGDARLAVALAASGPPAPPPRPRPRRLLHRRGISGRGAEAGGWEGGGWALLRAVQRHLRPSRGAHRRAAEDARLRGSTLPPRHTRGK
jgi:hypothetical protein